MLLFWVCHSFAGVCVYVPYCPMYTGLYTPCQLTVLIFLRDNIPTYGTVSSNLGWRHQAPEKKTQGVDLFLLHLGCPVAVGLAFPGLRVHLLFKPLYPRLQGSAGNMLSISRLYLVL